MAYPLTRRDVVAGFSALVGTAALPAQATPANPIGAIEARHGGRLGVFVLDTGSGRTLAHRADERFLMCSTFKGVLAALVTARVDAGHDRMTSLVPYGERDLLPSSPVTRAHVKSGALPVGTLCAAILQVSDNTAANLLLARAGGPQALTAFVRTLGDTVTRFDRYELYASRPSGEMDTTTPRAIAGTARALVLGNVLAPTSRKQLEQWMITCAVGLHRLRATLPPAWVVGDRTGTGDSECNDYAIARPPSRAPLVIAAYYDAPGSSLPAMEAVIAEIGSAVAAWAG